MKTIEETINYLESEIRKYRVATINYYELSHYEKDEVKKKLYKNISNDFSREWLRLENVLKFIKG